MWCLTNIASGNGTVRHLTEEAMLLPVLRGFVQSPETSDNIRENAIWCCGNIASDGTHFRDLIISLNVIQPIIQTLLSS